MNRQTIWTRRRKAVAVCMLLLGAIAAGILTATWHSSKATPQSQPVEEKPGVEQSNAQPSQVGLSLREEPRSNAAAPAIEDPASDPEPPVENDDLRRVRIECRDLAGEPVPGVELQVRIQAPTSTYGTPDWHSEYINMRTSLDGGFEVASKPSHELGVLLTEEERTKWFTNGVSTTFDQVELVSLVLRPVATLRLRVQYDDGIPYNGRATLHTLPGAGERYSLSWIPFAEDGTVTIPGVPTDRTLRTRNFERRPGYVGRDHWTYIEPHEWTSGQEVLIIVRKPEDAMGSVEVRFGDERPQRSPTRREPRYLVESTVGGPHQGNVAVGSAVWIKADLQPGGRYRVTFTGATAWQSDWFELKPGDVKVLHAELTAAASVRARLLDAQSQPLPGGILKLDDGAYGAYSGGPSPRARGSHPLDLPNDKGEVTLSGFPAGKQVFIAEAFGKAPRKIEVELQPGEEMDLGDVVLLDAIGRVTVQLSGMKEGVSYAIVVFQPNQGSSLYPYIPVSDAIGEVTGLPLRPYRVGVRRGDNGRIVGELVELSAENPHATIHVDASRIPD